MALRYLTLLALVASGSAICGLTDIHKAKECYRTYFNGFNISMGTGLPEYWQGFHDHREHWLLEDGLKAQPQICKLGNDLIQCVSSFRNCMDVETYVEMGAANVSEAQDWKVDLAATEYQCGAGYNLLMKEFYCMDFCRERYEPTLEECNTKFERDVILHGLCKAEQNMLNCQAAIFQTCCDVNAGVFMCGTTLAGFNAIDPKCSNEGKVACGTPQTAAQKISRLQSMRLRHGF